jgi:hypothetical protein
MESFFCYFIEVLCHQFRNFPKDFFYDEISGNNFLRKILENFILDCKSNEKLIDRFRKRITLFEFLKEFFNFTMLVENSKIIAKYLNEDYLDDEELPVI